MFDIFLLSGHKDKKHELHWKDKSFKEVNSNFQRNFISFYLNIHEYQLCFLSDFFSKPFGFMSCFLHKNVCSHFKCLKIYKFLDIVDFY